MKGRGRAYNEELPLTKKWWSGGGGGLKQQSVQDSQCDRLESCRRLGWGFNPQASGPSYLTAGNLTRSSGRGEREEVCESGKQKLSRELSTQPRLLFGVCWTFRPWKSTKHQTTTPNVFCSSSSTVFIGGLSWFSGLFWVLVTFFFFFFLKASVLSPTSRQNWSPQSSIAASL